MVEETFKEHMKKRVSGIKKKFIGLKEKYHPPTNYRRTMNLDPKDWGFKEFFFIFLFFFLAFRIMTKVYDDIMRSSNPSYYLNLAIVAMALLCVLIIVFRIALGRNPFIPHYKKPKI